MVAVGAPACGANAAVRSFVRMSLVQGFQVLGCYDSLGGLARGDLKPLEWMDVDGWAAKGGSMLGTKRFVAFYLVSLIRKDFTNTIFTEPDSKAL